jgi:hypothetical protein
MSLALLAPAPGAQTFVRITDPANPVVTDAYESGGGFWIDLVGDGRLDLFVANGNLSNQLNTLYRNDRLGGFVRVRTGAVANDGGSSIGGTFGDFDNDGHPDLFVTNRNNFGNFLYRGLGDTLFSKVTTGSPVTDIANSNSSSWVDVDNDGNLDLYVVNFQGNDFLYHNNGAPSFTFTRVDTTGLTTGAEFSIPGAWADYNNDGLEDLFIGNAGNQNNSLFTNHGNLFFTKSLFSDGRSTLGASWGDYDNDGNMDLFQADYLGQKSILYHNSGAPNYTLVPVDTGIVSNDPGSWVGSGWGDYDNDGYLDLYVANDGGHGALYHNNGPPGYGFTKITTGPIGTDVANSFGCAWGDYDRDGQLDLFVANRSNQPNFLYHNQGNSNHWIGVRCTGTASNRSGIGTKVRVFSKLGGSPAHQLREVTGQTGYNSGNLDQHFGLGDAVWVDSVRIEWPSGHRDTWKNLPADSLYFLTEGSAPTGVGGDPRGSAHGLRLEAPRPSPSRGTASLRFSLPKAGRAILEVFDVRGRRVAVALDRTLEAGSHVAGFSAPVNSPGGVYFCRLSFGGEQRVERIVLLR